MSKCPCKECISFALCNARLKERLNERETPSYLTALHILVLPKLVNCLELQEYLSLKVGSSNRDIERLCKTRDAFNLGGSND